MIQLISFLVLIYVYFKIRNLNIVKNRIILSKNDDVQEWLVDLDKLVILIASKIPIQIACLKIFEDTTSSKVYKSWYSKNHLLFSVNKNPKFSRGSIEYKMTRLFAKNAQFQSVGLLKESILSQRELENKINSILSQVKFSEKVISFTPYFFLFVMFLLGLVEFSNLIFLSITIGVLLQLIGKTIVSKMQKGIK